jgi:eukaryotic-like serine/threonine-protein kinase
MQPTESFRCPKCGADLASAGAECAHCLLDLGFATVATRLSDGTQPASGSALGYRNFAGYELLDEIARGGMGIVYRARQRSLGRTVALKLILGGQHATRQFVHRFRAEAAAAAALQHPNIVAIHEVGVQDGNHFFSMDYVEGQNLAQLVGNQPVPAEKAARYLGTIAEAIHYAHEQGILHRDLKPSNVLVDAATDQPRVTDFGLARRLDGESSLTMTGQLLGSPHFMPPEQADARRGKVGRPSDVYGLGGILYFLLTARPPFQGDSLETTLGQVLNAEPVSPRLLNASVPRDLETICLKCLDKEPVRRYPTARALAEDLDRFLKGEPTLARPTTRVEQAWRWCRRRPAITGLLATAIVLLLTISIGSPIAAFRIQHARQQEEANRYGADLNLVQTALAHADLRHARELLDRHRPAPGQRDHRGFEWRYLWTLCQGDEEYVFEPVIEWPRRVVFSPDGQMLAAGESWGKLSVVWDMATKAVVQTLPPGDRPVGFALDKPVLVTVGTNGLKLWNTQTWQERTLAPCYEEATATFTPDGRSLIVYGTGLHVWDTQDWTLVSSNDFGSVNTWVASTLRVSHDGTLISCGRGLPQATGAELRLFRLPSLELVPWSERLPKDISSAVFHPYHPLLVTGGWSGDIRLWDSTSGQELPSILKQASRIMAMSFHPVDSNVLATSGGDRNVQLWDLASQQQLARLHGAVEEFEELAFSPDGQTIAAGGHGNPITLYNVVQSKADIISVPTAARNCVLGFSEDGEQFLTIDAKGRVLARDATSLAVLEKVCELDFPSVTKHPSASLVPSDPNFRAAAMSATLDLKRIALGNLSGGVEIWDLASGTNLHFMAHTAPVRGLAFAPDARQLVSVGEDHDVHLWDLATLSRVVSARLDDISYAGHPTGVQFSPRGDFFAVGSLRQLSIFHRASLQRIEQFPDLEGFTSLRFSPDGRILVSGHLGGNLIVWDTRTWSRRPLLGHHLYVGQVAFSPDGRRMVSGAERLVIWDTDSWQQLARYQLPLHDINLITFSPDGNDLITSDADALRLWRAASFEDIAEREARLGRWR